MKPFPPILASLVDRTHFPAWLLEAHRPCARGVEIGTYRGEYAAHLLTHWNGELTTVDPFTAQPDEVYRDGCFNGGGGAPVNVADVLIEAMQRLEPWLQSKRAKLAVMTSKEAAAFEQDGSLDFVYIDSNHAYEAVREDIALWWRKLRPGGILGGHDFYSRCDQYQRADAANAVWDFADVIGVRPKITPCTSWWFVKP